MRTGRHWIIMVILSQRTYEQLLAFNYVKKLADGTTREDYDAEMKRRHEEYEKNMENNEPSEQIK